MFAGRAVQLLGQCLLVASSAWPFKRFTHSCCLTVNECSFQKGWVLCCIQRAQGRLFWPLASSRRWWLGVTTQGGLLAPASHTELRPDRQGYLSQQQLLLLTNSPQVPHVPHQRMSHRPGGTFQGSVLPAMFSHRTHFSFKSPRTSCECVITPSRGSSQWETSGLARHPLSHSWYVITSPQTSNDTFILRNGGGGVCVFLVTSRRAAEAAVTSHRNTE